MHNAVSDLGVKQTFVWVFVSILLEDLRWPLLAESGRSDLWCERPLTTQSGQRLLDQFKVRYDGFWALTDKRLR